MVVRDWEERAGGNHCLMGLAFQFCRMKRVLETSNGDGPVQFSSVQSLSRVRLFATPWTAARQASLSITNSRSLLKLMSIESVTPSSHLILCRPLLLLPPIPPSIRAFWRWWQCWLKNEPQPESRELLYLVGTLRTPSPGDSISVVLWNLLRGGRRGSQAIDKFATKGAGNLNVRDYW